MRSQRSDLTLILLCAVPVIGALVLYLDFQSTGHLPFTIPGIDTAAVNQFLSRFPNPASLLPGGSDGITRTVRAHPVLMVTGSVVGVLALVTLAGMWTDFSVARRQRNLARAAEDGESADTAPWLGDEPES